MGKVENETMGPRSTSGVTDCIILPLSDALVSISRQMTSCHIPMGPPGAAGCRLIAVYRSQSAGLKMSR